MLLSYFILSLLLLSWLFIILRWGCGSLHGLFDDNAAGLAESVFYEDAEDAVGTAGVLMDISLPVVTGFFAKFKEFLEIGGVWYFDYFETVNVVALDWVFA